MGRHKLRPILSPGCSELSARSKRSERRAMSPSHTAQAQLSTTFWFCSVCINQHLVCCDSSPWPCTCGSYVIAYETRKDAFCKAVACRGIVVNSYQIYICYNPPFVFVISTL